MLRLRLAANLLFNLLAVWVYYDARTRGARKPLFAAGLTLLWGPLRLGFRASCRRSSRCAYAGLRRQPCRFAFQANA